MFADDTNLFMCGKDLDVLFKNVNDELVKVALWFQANKLSLNVIKTKYSISKVHFYIDGSFIVFPF